MTYDETIAGESADVQAGNFEASELEMTLYAALNVLRDSNECGRMPSGLALTPGAAVVHERAVERLEALLRTVQGAA